MLHGLGAAVMLMSVAASIDRGGQAADTTPLGKCIAAEAEKLDFSGVVSIAQPEGRNFTFARGMVGATGSPAISAHTRFNLGSAGKMFTAVAVAQLVDEGKVRLNDPIGLHVKGLTPEAAAVTVRQLLTHSSGLGNFFSPENLTAIQKARTLSDLLPLVASDKPSYAPGSRFQYSNNGFLVLGLLVEQVSGQSYGHYLDLHLFKPAGMVASGLDPGPSATQAVGMTNMPEHPPRPAAGGADRVEHGPGEARPHGPLRPAPEAALRGSSAGGSYSTAADMQRFFAALLDGRLTSADMLKELGSPQIAAAPANGALPQLDYGFGFGVGAFAGHRWLGHNGGAPGVNVEAAAYPDDGTSLIVMSNRDPPSATVLFRKLRAALFDPGVLKSCSSVPQ